LILWGSIANYGGYAIPFVYFGAVYAAGMIKKDKYMQIAAMAAAQAALITQTINWTGRILLRRKPPSFDGSMGIKQDYSMDVGVAFLRGFDKKNGGIDIIDGWPSGHTISMMAAAAVMSEMYSDKIWVSIASYSLVAFIGVGMTFDSHWVSDVFAGALIGYAVGKVVSRNFKKLFNDNNKNDKRLSFFASPVSVGINYRY